MHDELVIDGKQVTGAATLDVINPATGEVFAQCARADAAQVEAAIVAADRAFPAWAAKPQAERRALLRELADRLEGAMGEIARVLTSEQGKPLAAARGEVMGAVMILRYYGDLELADELLKEDATCRAYEQYSPLGVVSAITPWNYPLLLSVAKIAPALSAGNTVVLKPAPTTPLTVARLVALSVGLLPPGVLNLVIDAGDLGQLLTSDPRVAKISFTGSSKTGARVMESGAASLKRITLELGGNDAALVLDDADLDKTAAAVLKAAMGNAGQVCIATKRVYVPEAKYDQFCDKVAELAGKIVVGNGLEEGTEMGPLQNAAQFERVMGLIEDAAAQGKVIAGGSRTNGKGYFIAPTIVRDLPDDARLVREEQFGPALPILSYRSVDEVIDRINDSEYGLAGSVWTSDPERGLAIARRIESGWVWVNTHGVVTFDLPFGGAKHSGMGKEFGMAGLKEYSQAKTIHVAL
jgi:acyl-CoA reductase-like NAD-dependent aldehyde dehydrogenase